MQRRVTLANPRLSLFSQTMMNSIPTDMDGMKERLTLVIKSVEALLKPLYPTPYQAPSQAAINDNIPLLENEITVVGRGLRDRIMAANPDEATKALCHHFNTRCGQILAYAQFLSFPNMKNAVESTDETKVIEYIREDNIECLKLLILANQRYDLKRAYLDVNAVLRRAAYIGSKAIIGQLLDPTVVHPTVDVLSHLSSGKIALHRAIEESRDTMGCEENKLECFKLLLSAKGVDGEKTVLRQLLLGTKPKRPLDNLLSQSNESLKNQMLSIISGLDLSIEPGVNPADIDELLDILDMRHASAFQR